MTVRNARAGPLGTRRPYSQCSSVLLLNPNNRANSAWESAIFSRIAFTIYLAGNMNGAAVRDVAIRKGQRLFGAFDHSLSWR